MGKHSEGPWEVATSCSWRRILTRDGAGVCVPTIQRGDNHPDLHFPNGGAEGPDARLIAAAPDLLAALQAVIDEYMDGYGLICVDQVRAAIVKATGDFNA